VLFEAKLSNRVQWLLGHLDADDVDRVVACIQALRLNPYRDIEERVTLVMPLERVYRDAYRCGGWAIAYEFEDEGTLLIEAIGNLFY
jgi:hypothetical protein